jgi:probable HAF family extracellular repeat protein
VSGLNALGQVVGSTSIEGVGARAHAFRWSESGGMQDLGTLVPGGRFSSPSGINDLGQVAGSSDATDGRSHAVRWTESGDLQDLGTLPGGASSGASGINDRG